MKEVAGKVLGDSKLKSEGKGDQVKGKVQNAVGGIKDTLRGRLKICCCVARTEPHHGLCFLSVVVFLKWVTSGHQTSLTF